MPDPEKVDAQDTTDAYVDPEVVAHADDSDDAPCGAHAGSCGTDASE